MKRSPPAAATRPPKAAGWLLKPELLVAAGTGPVAEPLLVSAGLAVAPVCEEEPPLPPVLSAVVDAPPAVVVSPALQSVS